MEAEKDSNEKWASSDEDLQVSPEDYLENSLLYGDLNSTVFLSPSIKIPLVQYWKRTIIVCVASASIIADFISTHLRKGCPNGLFFCLTVVLLQFLLSIMYFCILLDI